MIAGGSIRRGVTRQAAPCHEPAGGFAKTLLVGRRRGLLQGPAASTGGLIGCDAALATLSYGDAAYVIDELATCKLILNNPALN